jgi:hypothetical protein
MKVHRSPTKLEAGSPRSVGGLESDPKFQNPLHWRRHQAPGLSVAFGGRPEGMGRQGWRRCTRHLLTRLGQRALFADHVRTRRKETNERRTGRPAIDALRETRRSGRCVLPRSKQATVFFVGRFYRLYFLK